MRKPVVLKGPGVTTEDFIRMFKMSPERVALIREIVEEVENRMKAPRTRKNLDRPAPRHKKKAAPRICPA